jgi:MbtH protein
VSDQRGGRAFYKVVVNHEEQYSIWPAHRESPEGWRDEGTVGSLEECQDHVRKIWTDLRPLSVRKEMGEAG